MTLFALVVDVINHVRSVEDIRELLDAYEALRETAQLVSQGKASARWLEAALAIVREKEKSV